MTALQKAGDGRHKEAVQLLSESKDFRVNSNIDQHKGLLSWAAELGYDETVELMTSKSHIEIDLENEEGQTALSYAAENGHEEIVRLLLKEELKPAHKMRMWREHKSLLQNGAILQADKDDGCTALHNLVFNFNDEHIRYLKEQRAPLQCHGRLQIDVRSFIVFWWA
ncbi:hypothetical protein ABVK25_009192 [Lepraria finkii]|uniref:Uncharacterized protein n=1 Tax=Lepraria finkii TaxID=1340010 RepID=A0ABR4AZE9_9LECA